MNAEKTNFENIADSEVSEAVTKDDRQLAMMCHVLGLVTGIITPLIFCLVKKGDSKFLLRHETEALNFQITILIGCGIAIYSDCVVTRSIFLIPVVIIIDVILCITAAIKANESIYYKYPISIPFIRGNR